MWFAKLAQTGQPSAGRKRESREFDDGSGRTHVIPSTKETVQLGVYDTNLPPLLTIDSGDSLTFPETWSGFLNELQPGVPIDTLVKIRLNNPGKGPQSIIGPIAVNKAEPGDVLEIRSKRFMRTNGALSSTTQPRSGQASFRKTIRRGRSSTSILISAP